MCFILPTIIAQYYRFAPNGVALISRKCENDEAVLAIILLQSLKFEFFQFKELDFQRINYLTTKQ